jgi:hypothetical protein
MINWLNGFGTWLAALLAGILELLKAFLPAVAIGLLLTAASGCILENLPGQITGLVCPDCPEPEDACLDWLEDEVDAIME